ncbi:MAG: DUF5615 family PIN-like protein [Candidatus Limnocylindria bacterium]
MRLLVDEDTASDDLMSRLRKAGHHVERTLTGTLDSAVWTYAQEAERIVVTGNADDFIPLAERTLDHHGLLTHYGERDPVQQMRANDIATAIENIRDVYGDRLRGVRLTLNEWRRSRAT